MVRILTLLLMVLTVSFVSAKEKPKITLTQSENQVWQRQQTIITLTLITDDPFSRLEVEPFQQKGFSIIAYKQQREENKDHVLLTMKWAVYPFVAGTHQLELPKIVYRPNGGRKQKLTLKNLSLNVKRLPVYVPPTMPVGNIQLESHWDSFWLTSTHHLLNWHVKVYGKGVAKQTMPPITRQIINSSSLRFSPAKQLKNTRFLQNGITNESRYNIPLKASKNGIIDFPTIKVQYFEPTTGKLQITQLSPPWILSLSKWIQVLIAVIVLIGMMILFVVLFNVIRQLLQKLVQKKKALNQLKQATNYQQIKEALNQYATAKEWQTNASFTAFIKHWEQEFGASPALTQALNKLQASEFSDHEKSDFKALSQGLFNAISIK